MPSDRNEIVSRKVSKLGDYTLLRKLGEGGMGAVYKARQGGLDRIVALKVLPPRLGHDTLYIKRFVKEARASGKLVHPNIVQGIDVGQDPESGLWYFAMEYISGQSLRQILTEQWLLPERHVLKVGLAVAAALSCAHKHGIVHRDIKPDNILVAKTGEIKLADLGLAKQLDATTITQITRQGCIVGTPLYMAPEQAQGKIESIGFQSDLYALGATLFHLATGQPPFTAPTPAALLHKHIHATPPLAHKLNPQLSESLGYVINLLLYKKPHARPDSPDELFALLTRIKQGEILDVADTAPRTALRLPRVR